MGLALVLLIGFILRLPFSFYGASDEYSHMWMIKQRKKFRNLYKDNVDNSLIEGYRGYPPLSHYIISLFSERYWLLVGRLLNLLYDLIATIIVYYIASFLFENAWHLSLKGVISAPTAAALLYATSPIFYPVTARLRGIGGRTMGNMFFLIYIILFSYAFLTNSYLVYLLCFPVGWLIILSSQFAIQCLVLCSLCLSVLYLNLIPIMLICVVMFSGILIPKLGIRKLLQRKIDHYIWYIRNWYRKKTAISNRNRLKDILMLPFYLVKKPKHFFYLYFKEITPLIAAYSVPPLLIFAFWIIRSPQTTSLFTDNEPILFLTSLSISTLFLFIFASLRPFLFLGQAERYFEYSAGFIYILFIYRICNANINPNIIFWVLSFQLAVIIMNFIFTQKESPFKGFKSGKIDSFNTLVDFLKSNRDLKILSIPTKWNFKLATHLDDTDALFYYDNISRHNKIDGIRYMEDDHIFLHYVKSDMRYFMNKYGINTVVIQKEALDNAKSLDVEYKFENRDKIFENDKYLVYKIAQR